MLLLASVPLAAAAAGGDDPYYFELKTPGGPLPIEVRRSVPEGGGPPIVVVVNGDERIATVAHFDDRGPARII
ncbi:MAG: hypothetical protein K8E66_00145, partial [Phycisphaerales bacterium]|nr:hypothetical protein [Phycisphaerales bacterium]